MNRYLINSKAQINRNIIKRVLEGLAREGRVFPKPKSVNKPLKPMDDVTKFYRLSRKKASSPYDKDDRKSERVKIKNVSVNLKRLPSNLSQEYINNLLNKNESVKIKKWEILPKTLQTKRK